MGVITFESNDTYAVPPARMFKALVLESDQLFPKIFPDAIKNIDVVEGDGGAGSIKKITFAEGGQVNDVKHKIEEVDKVNLKTSYSIIEGAILADQLEKISYDNQWVPSPDGGSICKTICKLYTKGELEVTEEQFNAGKEKSAAMVKALEAYLLANPDVCN
ncbi:hypothetical protein WN944_025392 [Citrus x changshan-huyou]|uniref:Bet v 1 domain-containing protein n=3 Tax=Citrus TaxID=2706 RepID=A0ACB8I970_CITSI|nr:Bet v 1 domain-containing protein [Citrus sinensis]KDO71805.1 hypothetical protein CISIN_1g036858mg [Citrus sinensis]